MKPNEKALTDAECDEIRAMLPDAHRCTYPETPCQDCHENEQFYRLCAQAKSANKLRLAFEGVDALCYLRPSGLSEEQARTLGHIAHAALQEPQ